MSEIIYHSELVVFESGNLNGRDGAIFAFKSAEKQEDFDNFVTFKNAEEAVYFAESLVDFVNKKED